MHVANGAQTEHVNASIPWGCEARDILDRDPLGPFPHVGGLSAAWNRIPARIKTIARAWRASGAMVMGRLAAILSFVTVYNTMCAGGRGPPPLEGSTLDNAVGIFSGAFPGIAGGRLQR